MARLPPVVRLLMIILLATCNLSSVTYAQEEACIPNEQCYLDSPLNPHVNCEARAYGDSSGQCYGIWTLVENCACDEYYRISSSNDFFWCTTDGWEINREPRNPNEITCKAPCWSDADRSATSINSHNEVTQVAMDTDYLSYSCPEGFINEGDPVVTCYDGEWDEHQPFRCFAPCTLPPYYVSVVATILTVPHGDFVPIMCSLGNAPEILLASCTNGTLELVSGNEIPQCPKQCSNPIADMSDVDADPSQEKYENGTVIWYSCSEGGHTINGPLGALCLHGDWVPEQVPTCEGKGTRGLTNPPGTTFQQFVFSAEVCGDDYFICDDGQCIPYDNECDGYPHCSSYEDEHSGCVASCSYYEFTCDDGGCIPDYYVCNGYAECPYGEDEYNCDATCSYYEFTCYDGSCIPTNNVCNGYSECPYGEDEYNCAVCHGWEVRCSTGTCIPEIFQCDGVYDCPFGEDETNCTNACYDWEFPCSNGTCIPVSFQCDGTNNCVSGEDEANCTSQDVCGKSLFELPRQRIVGGSEAALGSWPWQAYLEFRSFLCGAVLINESWVATAAHCVGNPGMRANLEAVVLGEINLYEQTKTRVRRPVERIFVHPGYQPFVIDNDIALLKLAEPVKFDNNVRPVCLPKSNDTDEVERYSNCYVTGWGATYFYGSPSTELLEARIPLMNRTLCDQYLRQQGRNTITDNMLCAGYEEGQTSTCQGDSGGPLVCEKDGRWTLVGLTSWAYGCGDPQSPAVYARVSKYRDLIDSVIREDPEIPCEPVISTCASQLPYNATFETSQEVIAEFVNLVLDYYTYDDDNITTSSPETQYDFCADEDIDPLFCGVYFKGCPESRVPCREHCESVARSCILSDYSCTYLPYGLNDTQDWCIEDTDYCGENSFALTNGSSVELSNPFFPLGNIGNRDCIWFFSVPSGQYILVKFRQLLINPHTHTLSIGYGTDPDNRSTTVAKLFDDPLLVVVEDDEGWIRFETSNSDYYIGFDLVVYAFDSSNVTFPCSNDSLVCSGFCLPESWLCDGVTDCDNSRDEYGCPNTCEFDEFQCTNGGCIPNYWVCDGYVDCELGEDESEECFSATCGYFEFTCYDGNCIPSHYVCNGYSECAYGEDEINCGTNITVMPGENFTFTSHDDYPYEYSNSYEALWTFSTNPGHRMLLSFQYLFTERRYDYVTVGNDDSASSLLLRWSGGPVTDYPKILSTGNNMWVRFLTDGSVTKQGFAASVVVINETDLSCDEEFDCDNGVCLPSQAVCNGEVNCIGGADDEECNSVVTCSYDEFTCYDGSCLPNYYVCNGYAECSYGEDEYNCAICHGWELQCSTGTCIPEIFQCDGDYDCPFGEDENNCTNACYDWEFACSNGTCIPVSFQCDGINNCVFGEDEANCTSQDVCGKSLFGPSQRIVGGSEAALGSWPWQAYLEFRSFLCGAVLINESWVATAAHCVGDPGARANLEAVVLGEINLYEQTKTRVRRPVERIFVHPGYQPFVIDNDIALLKLAEPVKFDNNVRPVCLPKSNETDEVERYSNCYVTGWGATYFYGSPSTELLEARIPLMNRTLCDQYLRQQGRNTITDNMLCAGYEEGQTSTCQGDSGGPLVCEKDGRWTLVGLTSWGYGCGDPQSPTVYARVSKYRDLIDSVIREDPEIPCEPVISTCASQLPYNATFETSQEVVAEFVNLVLDYYTYDDDNITTSSPYETQYDFCADEDIDPLFCGVFFKGCPESRVPCREHCESVARSCILSDYLCTFLPYGFNATQDWCIEDTDYCGENNFLLTNGSSVELSNPFFPLGNIGNRDCIWFFSVPSGQYILVKFRNFLINPYTHTLSIGYGDDPDNRTTTVAKLFDDPFLVVVEDDKGWIRFETTNSDYYIGFDLVVHAFDSPNVTFSCSNDSLVCNGFCLPESWLCDGVPDCDDGRDEYGCPATCQLDEFQCRDESCIPNYRICDGLVDCGLGEDELDGCLIGIVGEMIHVKTTYNITSPGYPDNYANDMIKLWEFSTDPGNRLLLAFDLIHTEMFRDHLFVGEGNLSSSVLLDPLLTWSGGPVYNQTKILSSSNTMWVLFTSNFYVTAQGFSGEVQVFNDSVGDFNCDGHFDCENGVCLSPTGHCNGEYNCNTGLDEECNATCSYNEFTCYDGSCVSNDYVCDGYSECPYGEDEFNCDASCSHDEFTCYDGDCIPDYYVCNGYPQCSSGEDEYNCGQFVTSTNFTLASPNWPEQYPHNRNQSWVFWTNNGSRISLNFEEMSIERGFDFLRVGNGNVTGQNEILLWSGEANDPYNIQVLSSGPSLWISFVTDFSVASTGFRITIRAVNQSAELDCGGNFKCSDSICLSPLVVCDETKNCANGADETIEACAGPCNCSNSSCIPRSVLCDDVQHCPNNIDETGCPERLCGTRTTGQVSSRIVGGVAAEPGEWPWQASIHERDYFGGHLCGGTLLNKRWVLSASHCFESSSNPSNYKIVLGNHEQSTFNRGQQRSYFVERIINHPYYNPGTSINDITLMKLKSDADYSNYILPACLPSQDWPAGTDTWVTGWGNQEDIYDERLQEITVPTIDTTTCNQPDWYGGAVADCCMFCAGLEEGGKDSCQGDSGGPLVVENNAGKFEVIGITSWGYGCADYKSPGVYTKVYNYLDWINSTMSTDMN